MTSDEKAGEVAFHKSRRMFVVHSKSIWFGDDNDARSHSEWCKDEGWDDVGAMVRGFIDSRGVFLYRGPEFSMDEVVFETYLKVRRHFKLFAPMGASVYGGMNVGKIGELWAPISLLGVVQ